MPRSSKDYQIEIPVTIKDKTQQGAKSVNTTVDKMAQDAQRAAAQSAAAADSLQRQRSSALIAQWRKDESEKTRIVQQAQRERDRAEKAGQSAASSLQRQRSQALLAQWRQDEQAKTKAVQQAANERERIEKSNASAVQSLQRQRSQALIQAWNREQQEFAKVQQSNIKAAQEAAQKQTDAMNESWKTIHQVASVALAALAVGLAAVIVDTTLFAGRTEELTIALHQMAKANHIEREEVDKQLKGLIKLNIARQEATQILAQVIGANLDFTKASTLARIAQDTAVISGKNSSEAFSDLANAILIGTTQAFRAAGVFISVRAELDKGAKAIGLNRNALSEMQRQQILTNAVIAYGTRLEGTYEAAMGSASKQMRSLVRVVADTKQAFGDLFQVEFMFAVKAAKLLLEVLGAYPGLFLALTTSLTLLTAAIVVTTTAAVPSMIKTFIELARVIVIVGKVMVGTASLIQGAAATTVVATLGWAALAIAVLAVVYALTKEESAMDRANAVTLDSIKASAEAYSAQQQLAVAAKDVAAQQTGSAEQHEKLNTVLGSLDPVTRQYIEALKKEEVQVKALNVEIERTLALKKLELEATLRVVGGGVLEQLEAIKLQTSQIEAIEAQIRVEQELMSKDPSWAETLRPAIQNLSQSELDHKKTLDDLNKSLTDNQVKLVETAKALGMNRDQFEAFFKASGYSGDALQKLLAQYDAFTPKVDAATKALKEQVKTLEEVRKELKNLLDVGDLEIESKILEITRGAKSAAEARRMAQQALKDNPELKKLLDQRKAYTEAEKAAREVLEPSVKKTTSAMESLEKQTQRTEFAVNSLYATAGKGFQLQFKKEDLEATKRDLENILKLEHQLALPMVLPSRESGIRGIREMTRTLESQKKVVEEVTNAQYAQQDAQFKLAQLILQSSIPLVDAETRGQIKYLTAIEERRNAELELTSDLKAAVLLRTRAMEEEQRTMKDTFTQYVTLQKDAIKASEDARLANIRASLQLAIDTGAEPELQRKLEVQLKTQQEQLKPPLVKMSDNVNIIVKQLNDILGAISGKSGGTTQAGAQSYNFIGGNLSGAQQAGLTANLRKVQSSPAIQKAVAAAAAATGLPIELINSVITSESSGNVRALSPKGAAGLMQIMPAHGLGDKAFDIKTNVMTGTKYLASLMEKFNGDMALALAAYNAGPGKALTAIKNFTETKDYVRRNEFLMNLQSGRKVPVQPPEPFKGIPILNTLFKRQDEPEMDVERTETHGASVSVAVEQAATRATVANTQAKLAVDELVTAEQRLTAAQQEDAEKRKILAELGRGSLEQLGVEAALKDRAAQRITEDAQQAVRAGVVQHDLAEARARDIKYVERLTTDANRARAESEKATVDQIIINEEHLQKLRLGNLEEWQRLNDKAVEDRQNAEGSLYQNIATLEDKIAHAGEDSAARRRLAHLNAINDIIEADEAAADRLIENQVKIADATIYHATQADAKVTDFLASQKSVTDLIADAKIGVIQSTFDLIDRGLEKATNKLGIMKGIVHDLLSGFIRLALSQFFKAIFTGQSSGTGGLGGIFGGGGVGGQSQGSGGILSTILGAFTGGGGGGQGASIGGLFGGGSGGGLLGLLGAGGAILGGGSVYGGQGSIIQSLTRDRLAAPTTLTSQLASLTQGFGFGGGGGGRGGGILGTLLGGGGLKLGGATGLLQSLGPLAPLLGVALGAKLGGSSLPGGILGGIGGGLAGLGIGAGLSFAAGGGAFGASVYGGLMGIPGLSGLSAFFGGLGGAGSLGAFLSVAGPLAVVAAPLIVGAILLGRAKQRKKEEAERDRLKDDIFGQLDLLLAQAKDGQVTPNVARTQAQQLVDDYYKQVSQFKTGSVKKSAENFRPFFNARVQAIYNAAMKAETAKENVARIVPEFGSGGATWTAFTGKVPGDYSHASNTRFIGVTGREAVLNPTHISRLPDKEYTLGNAGVPGYPKNEGKFSFGGRSEDRTDIPSSGPVTFRADRVVLQVGKNDATEIVFEGLRAEKNKKAVQGMNSQSNLDRAG